MDTGFDWIDKEKLSDNTRVAKKPWRELKQMFLPEDLSSDLTPIAGTTWKELKRFAMNENYR